MQDISYCNFYGLHGRPSLLSTEFLVCIYIFASHIVVCVVYVVKEVASFWGAQSINECGTYTNACSSYSRILG